MPPSATATPPTQTAHCAPRRSSRLILAVSDVGCGGGDAGGTTGEGVARASSCVGGAGSTSRGSASDTAMGSAGGTGAPCGAWAAGGVAAARRPSSEASRASRRRKSPSSPIDFASAAMAMIGTASSSSTASRSNIAIPSPASSLRCYRSNDASESMPSCGPGAEWPARAHSETRDATFRVQQGKRNYSNSSRNGLAS